MHFHNESIGMQLDGLLEELQQSKKVCMPPGRFDQMETMIRELNYKIKKVEEVMSRVDNNFVSWTEHHTKVHNATLNAKIVELEFRIIELERENQSKG